ncbi:MAG: sulfite exporter TauE/SafE family protein [Burkholderiales bacterium]
MTDSTTILLWIGITFIAAGLVKGVLGMGLPTVAMGLLSLVMAPAAAAAMLVVPSLVTNVWQLLAGPAFGALLRRLGTMMIAIFAGTILSIGVLTGQSASLAGAALGAILVLYGALGFTAPHFTVSAKVEYWLSPLIGLVTGLITGATGIFVIPAVPYLNSLGLAKDNLIQALGLSFTVSTLALACALGLGGQFRLEAASTSLLAVIPALAGMFLGQRVREKIHPEVFRRWFFIGLVVLGMYMIARVFVAK